MRVLGVVLLSLAISSFGLLKAVSLGDRAEQIELSVRLVRDVREQIRISKRDAGQILTLMRERYGKVRWLKGDSRDGDVSAVGAGFISGLGRSDTDGQLSHCDIYIADFSRMLAEAKRDKSEKSRLYTALGAAAGLAVLILLI